MSVTRFGMLVVVVVALACTLVIGRSVELREGYRLEQLLDRNELLSFSMEKTRLQLCRLTSPAVLENKALAMGVSLKPVVDEALRASDICLAVSGDTSPMVVQVR